MECRQTYRILHLYAEGLLGYEDAIGVKQHLDACIECKRRLDVLLRVYAHVEDEKSEYKPNQLLASSVWARANSKPKQYLGSLPPIRAIAITTLAAAGIALGVVLGTIFNGYVERIQLAEQGWQSLTHEYFPDEKLFIPYDYIDTDD